MCQGRALNVTLAVSRERAAEMAFEAKPSDRDRDKRNMHLAFVGGVCVCVCGCVCVCVVCVCVCVCVGVCVGRQWSSYHILNCCPLSSISPLYLSTRLSLSLSKTSTLSLRKARACPSLTP